MQRWNVGTTLRIVFSFILFLLVAHQSSLNQASTCICLVELDCRPEVLLLFYISWIHATLQKSLNLFLSKHYYFTHIKQISILYKSYTHYETFINSVQVIFNMIPGLTLATTVSNTLPHKYALTPRPTNKNKLFGLDIQIRWNRYLRVFI